MENKLPPRLVRLIEEYLDKPGGYSRETVANLMELAYRIGQNDILQTFLEKRSKL